MDRIDGLYKLCIKQPFDIEEIQCFIKSNKMNSEEVTRVAVKIFITVIKEEAAEKSAAYSLRKDIESTGVLWYNIYVNYTAQKHWGER